ncbi:MAG: hypothetical protein AMJ62_13525 [Myxococcales bacterium SG8_38]|nr:MAG: hypothetical protein AMJ62_13525 [Myxococcales bacterium SG8_38]
MQSPKAQDEQLQLLFDGELAPEEEAVVRRRLEGSEEELAQLGQWEQLRAAMKSASAEWAGELDSDTLFARIEAEIGAPAEATPLESQPPQEAVIVKPTPLRAVPGRQERRVWAAVATGFAAAAAVLLAVVAWPSGPSGPSVDGASAVRGSEVVEVDFGSNTGTIFEVEGGAGESLAVVWIDEEEVAIP